MFNPLVDSIESLSEDEIQIKLSELSRKYWQSRNPSVKQQIQTVMEMYKQELFIRKQKEMHKSKDSDDKDLDNLIKIS
jgi:hypothetical protein